MRALKVVTFFVSTVCLLVSACLSASQLEYISRKALIEQVKLVEYESTEGIAAKLVNFRVDESKVVSVNLRLHNKSDSPINHVSCNVIVSKDDKMVEAARVIFAKYYVVDSGESAMSSHGIFTDLNSDFKKFDEVRVDCRWDPGDGGRRNIQSGPVLVEFIERFTIASELPGIKLRLTNNSSETIHHAECGVDTKHGNLIVSSERVIFDLLRDIPPGASVLEEQILPGVDLTDDFISEPFDTANLNCLYLVR